MTEPCTHLTEAAGRPEPAGPSTARECVDCIAAGTRWVHLRKCLTDGEIRCCDSSPMQHASKHAAAVEHPVIRSYQPAEDWRWCYVDEVMA